MCSHHHNIITIITVKMQQLRMRCNFRPPDVAPVVLGCFDQFYTAHAHRLLFTSFQLNFWRLRQIPPPPRFPKKEGNNLATRRRVYAVTLTFVTRLELFQWIWCHVIKLCTKFKRNNIIRDGIFDDLACSCSPTSYGAILCRIVFKGAWYEL